MSYGSTGTTAASDAHPASDPLPGFTGYRTPRSSSGNPQAAGPGRASPVPAATVDTFRAPYAGESLTAALPGSSPLPWPSPRSKGLGTPSSPPSRAGLLTTPQASRHATDRIVAPPYRAFDAGLRPGPFPDRAASLLPGLLAATRTGLSPAGDDELTNSKIRCYVTASPPVLLGARMIRVSGRSRSYRRRAAATKSSGVDTQAIVTVAKKVRSALTAQATEPSRIDALVSALENALSALS